MSENTYQITPFMHVVQCDEAVRFLVDVIGFTPVVNQGGYAYLEREGAGLRILGHTNDPEGLGSPHRGYAYYIDVRDVGEVLEQIGDKLASLPTEDICGPVDQPYGQRELMIRAPDGNLIVFGQAIEELQRGERAVSTRPLD